MESRRVTLKGDLLPTIKSHPLETNIRKPRKNQVKGANYKLFSETQIWTKIVCEFPVHNSDLKSLKEQVAIKRERIQLKAQNMVEKRLETEKRIQMEMHTRHQQKREKLVSIGKSKKQGILSKIDQLQPHTVNPTLGLTPLNTVHASSTLLRSASPQLSTRALDAVTTDVHILTSNKLPSVIELQTKQITEKKCTRTRSKLYIQQKMELQAARRRYETSQQKLKAKQKILHPKRTAKPKFNFMVEKIDSMTIEPVKEYVPPPQTKIMTESELNEFMTRYKTVDLNNYKVSTKLI
jgi:hypothetical protein